MDLLEGSERILHGAAPEQAKKPSLERHAAQSETDRGVILRRKRGANALIASNAPGSNDGNLGRAPCLNAHYQFEDFHCSVQMSCRDLKS